MVRLQYSLGSLLKAVLLIGVWLGFLLTWLKPTLVATVLLLVVIGTASVIRKCPGWGALLILGEMLSVYALGSAFTTTGGPRRPLPQRHLLMGLGMALERYALDHNAYPPHAGFQNSSAALHFYLVKNGYIQIPATYTKSAPGGEVYLWSPDGVPIEYRLRTLLDGTRAPLLVHPGRDKQFGGSFDHSGNFVSDETDADANGISDSVDNFTRPALSK